MTFHILKCLVLKDAFSNFDSCPIYTRIQSSAYRTPTDYPGGRPIGDTMRDRGFELGTTENKSMKPQWQDKGLDPGTSGLQHHRPKS